MIRNLYISLALVLGAGAAERQNTADNPELQMAAGMYSSGKALAVGDLVTIVISESTASTKSESLGTEKTATANPTDVYPGGGSWKGVINKLSTADGLKVSNTSSFEGKGDTTSAESLTAKLTARVVDRHSNGTLVIRGERRVESRGEGTLIVVSGIIRPRDIASDNSISSDKLADANIHFETDGTTSNGSQPGWFWRFLQWINPF
ncbi:MAG: flagellar L-ring lipoprotein FlgH [Verrucomicrobiota bacterium]|jgi:flagellar L-ring protein precursor FlgH